MNHYKTAPERIAIWFTRPSSLVSKNTSPRDLWLSWLDTEEKDRWSRLHNPMDKDRYLVSHALLRSVLAQALELDPREIAFRKTESGKPLLDIGHANQPLHFSLTHTRDLAAVAISREAPLGLDLERLGRKTPSMAVARRYFTAAELADIERQPEHARTQRFLAYWTLKEACVKALGWGISSGLDQFEVQLTPMPHARGLTDSHDAMSAWHLQRIGFPGNYIGAIASTGILRPEIELLSWP